MTVSWSHCDLKKRMTVYSRSPDAAPKTAILELDGMEFRQAYAIGSALEAVYLEGMWAGKQSIADRIVEVIRGASLTVSSAGASRET